MNVFILIGIYLIIINIVGFAIMGIDKARSRKRAWRIPEATLFIIAIVGGSIGSIIGMRFFRHKTKHWYFVVGMPVILFLQVALILGIYFSPLEFVCF